MSASPAPSRSAVPPRRRAAGCVRLLASRAGGAAIEFAVLMPVLLAIISGLAEVGRLLYTGDALANAVREAARAAMVRGSASDDPATAAEIADLVRTRARSLAGDAIAVDVAFQPNNDPGSTIVITARFAHNFVMPPFSAMGPLELERATSVIIAN